MQQLDSKRLRIVELTHVSVDLEYNKDFVIVHLPRVDKFRKGDLKLFKKYLEDLNEFITTLGYSTLHAATDHPPTLKLAEKLGFKFLGEHNNLKVFKYAPSSPSNYSS